MKKRYEIWYKNLHEKQVYGDSFITLKKYHKIGLNNFFETYKEAEEFLINLENSRYFTLFEEYTILPIFEKI